VLVCGPKVTVDLQHLTASSDGAGSYVETFTTYASVPALFAPLSSGIKFLDEKMTDLSTHVAYIAYRGDVLPTDRLAFGGRYYIIDSADDPFHQTRILKLKLRMSPV
jgi:SPP1 family predicted phage head-tail adaptor